MAKASSVLEVLAKKAQYVKFMSDKCGAVPGTPRHAKNVEEFLEAALTVIRTTKTAISEDMAMDLEPLLRRVLSEEQKNVVMDAVCNKVGLVSPVCGAPATEESKKPNNPFID